MTAKEAYSGVLKVGDRVRIIATGEECVVWDVFAGSVDGRRVNVEIAPGLCVDISEVEKLK